MRKKMKKLLLASTALVATAGFAAAEVGLSGSAEIGIKNQYGEDHAEFHHDLDVTFSLSGETDGGIAFGATIDLDEVSNGIPDTMGPHSVFVSAQGLTLTIGDTDGAFDARIAETDGPAGSIADDHTTHAGFSSDGGFSPAEAGSDPIYFDPTGGPNNDGEVRQDGNFNPQTDVLIQPGSSGSDDGPGLGLDGFYDGQVARVDYAFSGATFSLSTEIDDLGDSSPIWGLGVSYDAELAGITLGFGLGYQWVSDYSTPDDGDVDSDVWGASISADFAAGFSGVVKYAAQSFSDDVTIGGVDADEITHFGIGVGYEMNQIALGLNWGSFHVDGDEVQSGIGFAANYDLGGGLVAQFGYGASTYENADDDDQFSLGLAMSF
jgi:outer membrane protein OmpU